MKVGRGGGGNGDERGQSGGERNKGRYGGKGSACIMT